MKSRFIAIPTLALAAVAVLSMSSCKASGMAITTRGQLLKINIEHPKDLPDGGEDNLDINISNRGVRSVEDVLIDVELPPQLVILDQTADRGLAASSDPGTNVYHFVAGKIQPGETSHLRFKVRTAFGTLSETGSVKVTAWQRNLPGDKLIETAVIKLRR